MELCLVLTPDDLMEGADSTILNHAHAALVGEDPSGTHSDNFKNLATNTKRYVVQSLIRQHCNLTGEEFAVIDLPADAQKDFVVSLIGKPKKGTTKRSDTPDAPAEEAPNEKRFVEVKSETDRDTSYKVTVEGKKAAHCECMGFRYYKTCKHVEKVQKDIDNPY